MVVMILWSTHQALHRASQQTLWWGGPAGGQRPPAGRRRRGDGSTSSLSAAVGGSGSESCRSPWRGEKVGQAAFVPTRLYMSSTHTHTHTNRIIYDCERSTDSHRWIIGPVKKRQKSGPVLQGCGQALPSLRLDWHFNWVSKPGDSRSSRCHSTTSHLWAAGETGQSNVDNILWYQTIKILGYLIPESHAKWWIKACNCLNGAWVEMLNVFEPSPPASCLTF